MSDLSKKELRRLKKEAKLARKTAKLLRRKQKAVEQSPEYERSKSRTERKKKKANTDKKRKRKDMDATSIDSRGDHEAVSASKTVLSLPTKRKKVNAEIDTVTKMEVDSKKKHKRKHHANDEETKLLPSLTSLTQVTDHSSAKKKKKKKKTEKEKSSKKVKKVLSLQKAAETETGDETMEVEEETKHREEEEEVSAVRSHAVDDWGAMDLELNLVTTSGGRRKAAEKALDVDAGYYQCQWSKAAVSAVSDAHTAVRVSDCGRYHSIMWASKVRIYDKTYHKYEKVIAPIPDEMRATRFEDEGAAKRRRGKRSKIACILRKYRGDVVGNSRFVQPSVAVMRQLLECSPLVIRESKWCAAIVHSIWCAVMSAASEFNWRFRNRSEYNFLLQNVRFSHTVADCHYLPMPHFITAANGQRLPRRGLKDGGALKHESRLAYSKRFRDDGKKATESSSLDDVSKLAVVSGANGVRFDAMMDGMTEPSAVPHVVDNEFHTLAALLRIAPSNLARDYLQTKFALKPADANSAVSLLASASLGNCTASVKRGLLKCQSAIGDGSVPLNVLYSMHAAAATDAVLGYNKSLAWFGFKERMRQSAVGRVFAEDCAAIGSAAFEQIVGAKLRAMADAINEGRANAGVAPMKVMDERQQLERIAVLENRFLDSALGSGWRKRAADARQKQRLLRQLKWRPPPTPDFVFSEALIVNHTAVHWVDAKKYLVSPKDKYKWNNLAKQCKTFTEFYGTGAFCCLGFFKKMPPLADCSVLFLDASAWN